MTKGYKTSEFWLSLCAVLVSAVVSSGAIENNTILQGIALVSGALAALGYSGTRAITKSGEAKSNALKQIGVLANPKD
tara:strand:+ start:261 stop:494 length:234 start_codon:yes stop_codon:yes gene_type:complete